MSIESLMPSNHLILCCPLLLLPSIFPSIRVFSNESALHIRWLKYWSFSFSPSSEYSGLISFRIVWFDLFTVQGTLKSLPQHHSSESINSLALSLSLWPLSGYVEWNPRESDPKLLSSCSLWAPHSHSWRQTLRIAHLWAASLLHWTRCQPRAPCPLGALASEWSCFSSDTGLPEAPNCEKSHDDVRALCSWYSGTGIANFRARPHPVCVWPLSKSLSFCESQFPHLLNRATDLTWRGSNKEVVEGHVDSLAHRGRAKMLGLLPLSGDHPGLPSLQVWGGDLTLGALQEEDSQSRSFAWFRASTPWWGWCWARLATWRVSGLRGHPEMCPGFWMGPLLGGWKKYCPTHPGRVLE